MQEALLVAVFLPPALLLVTAAGALAAFLLRADPSQREAAPAVAAPEPVLARVEQRARR